MGSSNELPPVPDAKGRPARPCEWCGAPVEQPPTGRERLHCKRAHRQRAYEARRLDRAETDGDRRSPKGPGRRGADPEAH